MQHYDDRLQFSSKLCSPGVKRINRMDIVLSSTRPLQLHTLTDLHSSYPRQGLKTFLKIF